MHVEFMDRSSQLIRKKTLRSLLANGGMWGSYGQLVAVTGPVFAGYALWLGLREADIALMTAIASLAGIIQPFSFLLVRKMKKQKRFIIVFGFLEVTLMLALISIPHLVQEEGHRLFLTAVWIASSTVMSHLVAPLFNSWFSAMLPEDNRSRFLASRLIIVNICAMAAGYLAGKFIDRTGAGYISFVLPYIVAWTTGIGGYLLLLRAPFPAHLYDDRKIPSLPILLVPFRHQSFRILLIFYLTWLFASFLSDPFYNVYMIKHLGISYSAIAVYTIIALGLGILGYRVWGNLGERYGTKPLLQLLLIPRALVPVAWIFLTPKNSSFVLPIMMIINGFFFSGLNVAINALLFGTVPNTAESSAFFAAWSFGSGLIIFLSSGFGSVLARSLSAVEIQLGWLNLNNLRIIFAVSGFSFLIPLILVHRLKDVKAKTVAHLLGQVMRGNSLAFALNAFRFSFVKEARIRARAVRGMGRSKSPMAVQKLIDALDDISPEVREEAARSLGETKAEEAVRALAEKLSDEESDIREEAAASLGKMGHPQGIPALLKVLDSEDERVAKSVIRALADIGDNEVREGLYKKLTSSENSRLLPAIVENLSKLGDIRIIKPAITALDTYRSPVIRFQLLNSVCRSLGAGNRFYRFLIFEEMNLDDQLHRLLKRITKRLKQRRAGEKCLKTIKMLENHLVEGRLDRIPIETLSAADQLLAGAPTEPPESGKISAAAREAMRLYMDLEQKGKVDRPELFFLVCLGLIVDDLYPGRGNNGPRTR